MSHILSLAFESRKYCNAWKQSNLSKKYCKAFQGAASGASINWSFLLLRVITGRSTRTTLAALPPTVDSLPWLKRNVLVHHLASLRLSEAIAFNLITDFTWMWGLSRAWMRRDQSENEFTLNRVEFVSKTIVLKTVFVWLVFFGSCALIQPHEGKSDKTTMETWVKLKSTEN